MTRKCGVRNCRHRNRDGFCSKSGKLWANDWTEKQASRQQKQKVFMPNVSEKPGGIKKGKCGVGQVWGFWEILFSAVAKP